MKHLTILVPRGENNLSSIVGSYKILSRANEIFLSKGKEKVFEIDLAGSKHQVDYYQGLFSVKPNKSLDDIQKTDFIIIPSLNHQYDMAIRENQDMIQWLKNQYRAGAEIASICTGAFLLASAGILDGKSCSTHWSAANELRSRYPKVKLLADHLITDEHGIYTNGGAYSFLNLMIYLVEKYYDRQTAILCAKIFQIEMDRNSQSIFSIFTGQKNHTDDMIMEAQHFMEQSFDDKLPVESISSRFAVSRRTFDRRFIRATGNTPTEYLQRLKIEAAKKALESSRKSVNEVMYEVGYNDPKAFRTIFTRITGTSPQDYKNRYNKSR